MEINRRDPLGPRLARSAGVPALSRARRSLLDLLEEQGRPTSLADLVALSGLHENTVRGHLDGLAAEGLVCRERDVPNGRGRPAWLWRTRSSQAGEYATLAATLARTLRRVSAQPEDDALDAGHGWGHRLAADHDGDGVVRDTATPISRVIDLLDELGFAPEGEVDAAADAAEVRLTRCPLLEAAVEETAVVCNVHLGLVLGALEQFGAPDPDAQLRPFAEPGACPLRVCVGAG